MIRIRIYRTTCGIVFVAMCLQLLDRADAQTWNRIGSFPLGTDLRCAYFWDAAHGVVGGADSIWGPGALYYYNAGVWLGGSRPEATDTVKSLRWLDGYYLYAASGATCIWKSSNHGVTWVKSSSLFQKADDVFIDIHGLDAVNDTAKGPMPMRGTSFAETASSPGAVRMVVARDDSTMDYSGSYGLTWNATGGFKSGYDVVADTCSRFFYTLSDGPDVILYRSMDSGISWQPEYDFGQTATDVLEGANLGVLYVQGQNNIWRSTSAGRTWENIGGPPVYRSDRRMFAFGEYNRYLIVPHANEVWLWDGGTNYLPTGPMPKVLSVTDVVDTNCTFPQLTINLIEQNHADTVRLHAYTTDSATIQPTDTTVIVPSGSTVFPVQFQTWIPPRHFSDQFYFDDTVSGVYECGQFRYTEDTAMHIAMPSYPLKILSVQNVTDTACALTTLEIDFQKSNNPDTVRVHAWTTDGLYIEPSDTILIVPVGSGVYPVKYRASAHPFQFASTFHFSDTVSGAFKCGTYRYVTDSSIHVELYPPPGSARCSLQRSLKFTTCTPTRIPLVVHAPNICDSLHIDSITWRSHVFNAQLDHQPPETLGPNGVDTFWMTFIEPVPSVYQDFCSVHCMSTVLPRPFDTAFGITASVVPSGARITVPEQVRLSNCKESSTALVLRGMPCDSIEITSCTIQFGRPMQFSTSTIPSALAMDSIDTIFVTIPPQGLSGAYLLSAELRGQYAGSDVTFDTTAQIRIYFTSTGSVLAASSDEIDFDTINTCMSEDTVVQFWNVGCDAITVTGDATGWQTGWTADDPTFPFTLGPDSIFSVRIHFVPQQGLLLSQQQINYRFKDIAGSDASSIPVELTASIQPQEAVIAISPSGIDFGIFTRCDAHADTTATFSHYGCDSLEVSAVSLDSGNGFGLAVADDTIIGPGESLAARIRFSDSTTGVRQSILHLHARALHGNTAIDTSITVRADIVPGTHRAMLSTDRLDLGAMRSCDVRDSFVTITNTGCETDTISRASLATVQFKIPDTFHFPLIIPPGQKRIIPIKTNLDSVNRPTVLTDTLRWVSNLDTVLSPVELSYAVSYPEHFSLLLAVADSAPIGKMVPIYVLRAGSIPPTADQIVFDITQNDDVLSYERANEPDIRMNNAIRLANGLTVRSFSFLPAQDRDTIAVLEFHSFLSNVDSTEVTLSQQQFLAGGIVSPPCIASIDTNTIQRTFYIELSCDDSTVLSAMDGSMPFTIVAIVPNPASQGLTLYLDRRSVGLLFYTLTDALGRTVFSNMVQGNQKSMDVSLIPVGLYVLRLSQNGFTQSRLIEVER